jgi:hypothetical protein
MNQKAPIIIKKLTSKATGTSTQEKRESKRLQTTQHTIRDFFSNRRSYY